MSLVIIFCLLLSWPLSVWQADANVTDQTKIPESFQQEINEIDRLIDRALQETASQTPPASVLPEIREVEQGSAPALVEASQVPESLQREVDERDRIIDQAIQEKTPPQLTLDEHDQEAKDESQPE